MCMALAHLDRESTGLQRLGRGPCVDQPVTTVPSSSSDTGSPNSITSFAGAYSRPVGLRPRTSRRRGRRMTDEPKQPPGNQPGAMIATILHPGRMGTQHPQEFRVLGGAGAVDGRARRAGTTACSANNKCPSPGASRSDSDDRRRPTRYSLSDEGYRFVPCGALGHGRTQFHNVGLPVQRQSSYDALPVTVERK